MKDLPGQLTGTVCSTSLTGPSSPTSKKIGLFGKQFGPDHGIGQAHCRRPTMAGRTKPAPCAAFTHLDKIKELRNDILHYGASLEGVNAWRVTNRNFVHVPKNISEKVISDETLKAAQLDLDQIDTMVIDLMLLGGATEVEKELFEEARDNYQWKYNP